MGVNGMTLPPRLPSAGANTVWTPLTALKLKDLLPGGVFPAVKFLRDRPLPGVAFLAGRGE
jgi:hypothetical protein